MGARGRACHGAYKLHVGPKVYQQLNIIVRAKYMSYQKKDGRGHAHPSFFLYDNDKDLKVCFLVTHIT